MTIRAMLLGLAIGLFISAFTYFNDFVAYQTLLIGHFMPVSVFGTITLALLALNPLLRRVGPSFPLRGREVAVTVAIALAACGYPGANLMRYFVTTTSMPPHLLKTQSSWRAVNIMSYLPGGSPRLAPGHVKDWPGLLQRMARQGDAAAPGSDEPGQLLAGRLYHLADLTDQHRWDGLIAEGDVPPGRVPLAIQMLNEVLALEAFAANLASAGSPAGRATEEPVAGDLSSDNTADAAEPADRLIAANRALLVKHLPEHFLPPPAGDHVLVTGHRFDPQVTGPLVLGLETGHPLPIHKVPWAAWWPTMRLWVGVILLLGGASLCLGLIVHPQWAHRELLRYPIAEFVNLISERQPGRALPTITRQKLFWLGFALVVGLHLLNGLHAWFDQLPWISLQFNFNPMRQLFPNASQVAQSEAVFTPRIFPSIVAFAFLLNRTTSFTMGISMFLFVALGSMLVAMGEHVPYAKFEPNKTNLLRFGSYLGLMVMVLYTGRRHYASVIRGALGFRLTRETPAYAIWAARLMAALIVMAIALMCTSGMSPLIATVLVAVVLLIWLGIARLVAETGMVLISGPFLPLGVLPWLLGYEALDPTQVILLGTAGALLVVDPREALMPYLINGLKMTDQQQVRPPRIAPVMAGMVVVGLVVAMVVTMSLQYKHGVNHRDGYAMRVVPGNGFDHATRVTRQLLATDEIEQSVGMSEWQRLLSIRPEPVGLAWAAVGFVLIVGVAVARLRLPWWPLHPLLFVVWGTWAMRWLAFSFLIGWMIKEATVRTSGGKGYRAILPGACGVIAGEMVSGLGWMIVGAIYQMATGLPPARYAIFP